MCTCCIQTIVLAVLFVEVIVILVRQTSHLRITRALRPIFLIDNVLMDEVRRYKYMYIIITVEPLSKDTPEMRTPPSIRIICIYGSSYINVTSVQNYP